MLLLLTIATIVLQVFSDQSDTTNSQGFQDINNTSMINKTKIRSNDNYENSTIPLTPGFLHSMDRLSKALNEIEQNQIPNRQKTRKERNLNLRASHSYPVIKNTTEQQRKKRHKHNRIHLTKRFQAKPTTEKNIHAEPKCETNSTTTNTTKLVQQIERSDKESEEFQKLNSAQEDQDEDEEDYDEDDDDEDYECEDENDDTGGWGDHGRCSLVKNPAPTEEMLNVTETILNKTQTQFNEITNKLDKSEKVANESETDTSLKSVSPASLITITERSVSPASLITITESYRELKKNSSKKNENREEKTEEKQKKVNGQLGRKVSRSRNKEREMSQEEKVKGIKSSKKSKLEIATGIETKMNNHRSKNESSAITSEANGENNSNATLKSAEEKVFEGKKKKLDQDNKSEAGNLKTEKSDSKNDSDGGKVDPCDEVKEKGRTSDGNKEQLIEKVLVPANKEETDVTVKEESRGECTEKSDPTLCEAPKSQVSAKKLNKGDNKDKSYFKRVDQLFRQREKTGCKESNETKRFKNIFEKSNREGKTSADRETNNKINSNNPESMTEKMTDTIVAKMTDPTKDDEKEWCKNEIKNQDNLRLAVSKNIDTLRNNSDGNKQSTADKISSLAVTETAICIFKNAEVSPVAVLKHDNICSKCNGWKSEEDSKQASTNDIKSKNKQDLRKQVKINNLSRFLPCQSIAPVAKPQPTDSISEVTAKVIEPVDASSKTPREREMLIITKINDTCSPEDKLELLQEQILKPLMEENSEKKRTPPCTTRCTGTSKIDSTTKTTTAKPTKTTRECTTTCRKITTKTTVNCTTTTPPTAQNKTECSVLNFLTKKKNNVTNVDATRLDENILRSIENQTSKSNIANKSQNDSKKSNYDNLSDKGLNDDKKEETKMVVTEATNVSIPDVCRDLKKKSDFPSLQKLEISSENRSSIPLSEEQSNQSMSQDVKTLNSTDFLKIQKPQDMNAQEMTENSTEVNSKEKSEIKKPLQLYLNMLNSFAKKSVKSENKRRKNIEEQEKQTDSTVVSKDESHGNAALSSPLTYEGSLQDSAKKLIQVYMSQVNQPTEISMYSKAPQTELENKINDLKNHERYIHIDNVELKDNERHGKNHDRYIDNAELKDNEKRGKNHDRYVDNAELKDNERHSKNHDRYIDNTELKDSERRGKNHDRYVDNTELKDNGRRDKKERIVATSEETNLLDLMYESTSAEPRKPFPLNIFKHKFFKKGSRKKIKISNDETTELAADEEWLGAREPVQDNDATSNTKDPSEMATMTTTEKSVRLGSKSEIKELLGALNTAKQMETGNSRQSLNESQKKQNATMSHTNSRFGNSLYAYSRDKMSKFKDGNKIMAKEKLTQEGISNDRQNEPQKESKLDGQSKSVSKNTENEMQDEESEIKSKPNFRKFSDKIRNLYKSRNNLLSESKKSEELSETAEENSDEPRHELHSKRSGRHFPHLALKNLQNYKTILQNDVRKLYDRSKKSNDTLDQNTEFDITDESSDLKDRKKSRKERRKSKKGKVARLNSDEIDDSTLRSFDPTYDNFMNLMRTKQKERRSLHHKNKLKNRIRKHIEEQGKRIRRDFPLLPQNSNNKIDSIGKLSNYENNGASDTLNRIESNENQPSSKRVISVDYKDSALVKKNDLVSTNQRNFNSMYCWTPSRTWSEQSDLSSSKKPGYLDTFLGLPDQTNSAFDQLFRPTQSNRNIEQSFNKTVKNTNNYFGILYNDKEGDTADGLINDPIFRSQNFGQRSVQKQNNVSLNPSNVSIATNLAKNQNNRDSLQLLTASNFENDRQNTTSNSSFSVSRNNLQHFFFAPTASVESGLELPEKLLNADTKDEKRLYQTASISSAPRENFSTNVDPLQSDQRYNNITLITIKQKNRFSINLPEITAEEKVRQVDKSFENTGNKKVILDLKSIQAALGNEPIKIIIELTTSKDQTEEMILRKNATIDSEDVNQNSLQLKTGMNQIKSEASHGAIDEEGNNLKPIEITTLKDLTEETLIRKNLTVDSEDINQNSLQLKTGMNQTKPEASHRTIDQEGNDFNATLEDQNLRNLKEHEYDLRDDLRNSNANCFLKQTRMTSNEKQRSLTELIANKSFAQSFQMNMADLSITTPTDDGQNIIGSNHPVNNVHGFQGVEKIKEPQIYALQAFQNQKDENRKSFQEDNSQGYNARLYNPGRYPTFMNPTTARFEKNQLPLEVGDGILKNTRKNMEPKTTVISYKPNFGEVVTRFKYEPLTRGFINLTTERQNFLEQQKPYRLFNSAQTFTKSKYDVSDQLIPPQVVYSLKLTEELDQKIRDENNKNAVQYPTKIRFMVTSAPFQQPVYSINSMAPTMEALKINSMKPQPRYNHIKYFSSSSLENEANKKTLQLTKPWRENLRTEPSLVTERQWVPHIAPNPGSVTFQREFDAKTVKQREAWEQNQRAEASDPIRQHSKPNYGLNPGSITDTSEYNIGSIIIAPEGQAFSGNNPVKSFKATTLETIDAVGPVTEQKTQEPAIDAAIIEHVFIRDNKKIQKETDDKIIPTETDDKIIPTETGKKKIPTDSKKIQTTIPRAGTSNLNTLNTFYDKALQAISDRNLINEKFPKYNHRKMYVFEITKVTPEFMRMHSYVKAEPTVTKVMKSGAEFTAPFKSKVSQTGKTKELSDSARLDTDKNEAELRTTVIADTQTTILALTASETSQTKTSETESSTDDDSSPALVTGRKTSRKKIESTGTTTCIELNMNDNNIESSEKNCLVDVLADHQEDTTLADSASQKIIDEEITALSATDSLILQNEFLFSPAKDRSSTKLTKKHKIFPTNDDSFHRNSGDKYADKTTKSAMTDESIINSEKGLRSNSSQDKLTQWSNKTDELNSGRGIQDGLLNRARIGYFTTTLLRVSKNLNLQIGRNDSNQMRKEENMLRAKSASNQNGKVDLKQERVDSNNFFDKDWIWSTATAPIESSSSQGPLETQDMKIQNLSEKADTIKSESKSNMHQYNNGLVEPRRQIDRLTCSENKTLKTESEIHSYNERNELLNSNMKILPPLHHFSKVSAAENQKMNPTTSLIFPTQITNAPLKSQTGSRRNHVIPRPVQFLCDNPKNYFPVLPVLQDSGNTSKVSFLKSHPIAETKLSTMHILSTATNQRNDKNNFQNLRFTPVFLNQSIQMSLLNQQEVSQNHTTIRPVKFQSNDLKVGQGKQRTLIVQKQTAEDLMEGYNQPLDLKPSSKVQSLTGNETKFANDLNKEELSQKNETIEQRLETDVQQPTESNNSSAKNSYEKENLPVCLTPRIEALSSGTKTNESSQSGFDKDLRVNTAETTGVNITHKLPQGQFYSNMNANNQFFEIQRVQEEPYCPKTESNIQSTRKNGPMLPMYGDRDSFDHERRIENSQWSSRDDGRDSRVNDGKNFRVAGTLFGETTELSTSKINEVYFSQQAKGYLPQKIEDLGDDFCHRERNYDKTSNTNNVKPKSEEELSVGKFAKIMETSTLKFEENLENYTMKREPTEGEKTHLAENKLYRKNYNEGNFSLEEKQRLDEGSNNKEFTLEKNINNTEGKIKTSNLLDTNNHFAKKISFKVDSFKTKAHENESREKYVKIPSHYSLSKISHITNIDKSDHEYVELTRNGTDFKNQDKTFLNQESQQSINNSKKDQNQFPDLKKNVPANKSERSSTENPVTITANQLEVLKDVQIFPAENFRNSSKMYKETRAKNYAAAKIGVELRKSTSIMDKDKNDNYAATRTPSPTLSIPKIQPTQKLFTQSSGPLLNFDITTETPFSLPLDGDILSGKLAMEVVDTVFTKVQESKHLSKEFGCCKRNLTKVKEEILPILAPMETKIQADVIKDLVSIINLYLVKQPKAACIVLPPELKLFLNGLIDDDDSSSLKTRKQGEQTQAFNFDPNNEHPKEHGEISKNVDKHNTEIKKSQTCSKDYPRLLTRKKIQCHNFDSGNGYLKERVETKVNKISKHDSKNAAGTGRPQQFGKNYSKMQTQQKFHGLNFDPNNEHSKGLGEDKTQAFGKNFSRLLIQQKVLNHKFNPNNQFLRVRPNINEKSERKLHERKNHTLIREPPVFDKTHQTMQKKQCERCSAEKIGKENRMLAQMKWKKHSWGLLSKRRKNTTLRTHVETNRKNVAKVETRKCSNHKFNKTNGKMDDLRVDSEEETNSNSMKINKRKVGGELGTKNFADINFMRTNGRKGGTILETGDYANPNFQFNKNKEGKESRLTEDPPNPEILLHSLKNNLNSNLGRSSFYDDEIDAQRRLVYTPSDHLHPLDFESENFDIMKSTRRCPATDLGLELEERTLFTARSERADSTTTETSDFEEKIVED